MPCCDTGRNIQKYKGATASTLQDVTDNGNTTTGDIITTSGYFIGDGSKLTNIPGVSGAAFNLEQVTAQGNWTSNTVDFQNTHTAFTTDLNSNVLVKIDQLYNVSITSPDDHKSLVYNSGTWIDDYIDFTSIEVKAGENLSKGDIVYVSGATGDTPIVHKANSSDPTKMPAIGVVMDGSINQNNNGHVVTFGVFSMPSLDPNFQVGEILYVSNTAVGELMNTVPFGNTDKIQNVGICVKSGGKILVTGVGRANDIPNAEIVTSQPSYIYVNSTGNELKKISASSLNTNVNTLQQVTDVSNTTSNTVQFTNTSTSIITSGNVIVGTNVHANEYYGDGTNLTGIALSSDLTDNVNRISTLEGEIQPVNRGGTGLTSYTIGDLLYASGTTTLSKLPVGNNGEVLTMTSGLPSWAVASGGGSSPWTILNSNIYYTTGNVGIGTTTPSAPLEIECEDSLIAGLLVKQSSSSYPARLIIETASSTQDPFMTFQYLGGTSPMGWSFGMDSSDGYGKLKWSIHDLYLTTNTQMTLDRFGNLGLGTTTPSYKLDAAGDINFTGALYANGSAGTSGQVLTSSGMGSAPTWTTVTGSGVSPWTISGSNIYYNSGNVGIGTTSPGYNLHVAGTSNFTDAMYLSGSAGTSGQVLTSSGTGSAPTWTTVSSGGSSPWTISGSNIYYNSGNVGIGTTNPNYKLHVAGTSNFTDAMYLSGSAGTSGQVLTSSGTGSAPTWTTVSGGSSPWSTLNSNVYYTSGNVGIGTTNPNYKLHVVGTSNFTDTMYLSGSVGSAGQVLTTNGPGFPPTWTTVSGGTGSSYWTQTGSDIYYITGSVGIANTAPTNTLDIGSNVSVIDDGVDKLYIRGNVYSTNDIISLGTIHTDVIRARDMFVKNTTIVAERPTRQVRLN